MDSKFRGRKHESLREKCFEFGKTCNKCGRMNHFAMRCKQEFRGGWRKETGKQGNK